MPTSEKVVPSVKSAISIPLSSEMMRMAVENLVGSTLAAGLFCVGLDDGVVEGLEVV
jgi:hypothetical protein